MTLEKSPIITSDNPISENILECLKNLYETPVGTVALNRDFGIDYSILDMPVSTAKQAYTVEIIKKTKKYEQRVDVESVSFQSVSDSNKLKPVIKIKSKREWAEAESVCEGKCCNAV